MQPPIGKNFHISGRIKLKNSSEHTFYYFFLVIPRKTKSNVARLDVVLFTLIVPIRWNWLPK